MYPTTTVARSSACGPLPEFFPANGPCGLAGDPFNLYVNYRHGGVANLATGVIDPGPATGIAVDSTSFDLFVDHRTSIAVYAAPVDPGDTPAFEIDPGPAGPLKEGFGVAVSSFPATAGQVYVADAADNTVKVYDPKVSLTTPVNVIDGAGTAAGRFVSLKDASLAIDQSNGHLFVVDNTQPGFEHPPGGDQRVQRRRPLSRPARTPDRRRPAGRDHRRRIRDHGQRPGLCDERQRLERRAPSRRGPAGLRTGRPPRLRPRRRRADARSDSLRNRAGIGQERHPPGSPARDPAKRNSTAARTSR